MRRLFVAAEPGEALRGVLGQVVADARRAVCTPGITWVKPQNLHITLKFVGGVADDTVSQVGDAIEETAARHRRVRLTIPSGVGGFGGRDRMRVLWFGVVQEPPILESLVRDLDRELEEIGFPAERRPFSPHVTFARVRRPGSRALQSAIERFLNRVNLPRVEPFELSRISLIESVLTANGSVCSVLSRYDLTCP